MVQPPYLKKTDKIALIAPARKVAHDEILYSVQVFKSWGLEVVYDGRLFNAFHQFGGTDVERVQYLQEALDNPEINAIISVRGGYGITRIIDQLDFTLFKKHPKWICGYSDVTALLCHVASLGYESIHSSMPMLFERDSKESIESLRLLLFGEEHSISAMPHPLNKKGKVEGELIGGNLSILNTLIATASDFNAKDKILFLEDIDEYLYNIDRMMVHLKRAGKLKNIRGLIVGHMTDMKDNAIPFGSSAYEIIDNWVTDLEIPVAFGFPVGHEPMNLALPVGRNSKLVVGASGAKLTFNNQGLIQASV